MKKITKFFKETFCKENLSTLSLYVITFITLAYFWVNL